MTQIKGLPSEIRASDYVAKLKGQDNLRDA